MKTGKRVLGSDGKYYKEMLGVHSVEAYHKRKREDGYASSSDDEEGDKDFKLEMRTTEAVAEAVADRIGQNLDRLEEKLQISVGNASTAINTAITAASAAATAAATLDRLDQKKKKELDRIRRGDAESSPDQRDILFLEAAATNRSILDFCKTN